MKHLAQKLLRPAYTQPETGWLRCLPDQHACRPVINRALMAAQQDTTLHDNCRKSDWELDV